jgi:hypothetical protein
VALTENQRLRNLIGEPIPDGGTDSDTLVSDEVVDDLLERHGSVEAALEEALAIKAALLITQVTTVEASSRRQLSDAHEAALNQAKAVGTGGLGGSRPTVIHPISRPFRR